VVNRVIEQVERVKTVKTVKALEGVEGDVDEGAAGVEVVVEPEYRFFIRSDVKGYYASMDHEILREQCQAVLGEATVDGMPMGEKGFSFLGFRVERGKVQISDEGWQRHRERVRQLTKHSATSGERRRYLERFCQWVLSENTRWKTRHDGLTDVFKTLLHGLFLFDIGLGFGGMGSECLKQSLDILVDQGFDLGGEDLLVSVGDGISHLSLGDLDRGLRSPVDVAKALPTGGCAASGVRGEALRPLEQFV
jgi:hypothetical protein